MRRRLWEQGQRVAPGAGDGREGVRGAKAQRSHDSHFSSCLTVLTLQTPHGAVLDVAHGAFASQTWPQPYLCTTLVHMVWAQIRRQADVAVRGGRTAGGAFCGSVGGRSRLLPV